MKKLHDSQISVGPDDDSTSTFEIVRGVVNIKVEGKYQPMTVRADLVLNHGGLRRLVQKAYDNKLKRSSDGPVTIHIREAATAT